MKKYFFLLFLVCLYLPFVVEAKENCKIISGNGKDIGSEVVCGTEHFYVIDSNEEDVKLLSKYNLMTNGRCDLYMFKEPYANEYDPQNHQNIKDEVLEILKLDENYEVYLSPFSVSRGNGSSINLSQYYFGDLKVNSEGKFVGFKICSLGYYKNGVTYKQDEKAIGFKGEMNNLSFPYEGLFQSPIPVENQAENPTEIYSITKEYHNIYKDILLKENLGESKVITSYKNYLLDNTNMTIKDISNLTLEETENLINKVSTRKISILDDINNFNFNNAKKEEEDENTGIYSSHYVVSNIKEVIPDKYKWIYGTTYWLNTIASDNNSTNPNRAFVLTLGEICVSDSCAFPSVGLRPAITIPVNNLQFIIRTKTDGNGTIDVINTASGGDTIEFNIKSKKDYKLSKLIITTDNEEKVEFKEGTFNEKDGICTIDKSVFTMPFDNVTIEAVWEPLIINPKTGIIDYVALFLSIIGVSVVIYNISSKKQNYLIQQKN